MSYTPDDRQQQLLQQIRSAITVQEKIQLYAEWDQLRREQCQLDQQRAYQSQKSIDQLITEIQNSRPTIALPVK